MTQKFAALVAFALITTTMIASQLIVTANINMRGRQLSVRRVYDGVTR